MGTEGADKIVCEHGRRNFSLRADGVLRIMCPVPDDIEVCGVAIFDAALDETRKLGIFVASCIPAAASAGMR